jgi:hypothetical protein
MPGPGVFTEPGSAPPTDWTQLHERFVNTLRDDIDRNNRQAADELSTIKDEIAAIKTAQGDGKKRPAAPMDVVSDGPADAPPVIKKRPRGDDDDAPMQGITDDAGGILEMGDVKQTGPLVDLNDDDDDDNWSVKTDPFVKSEQDTSLHYLENLAATTRADTVVPPVVVEHPLPFGAKPDIPYPSTHEDSLKIMQDVFRTGAGPLVVKSEPQLSAPHEQGPADMSVMDKQLIVHPTISERPAAAIPVRNDEGAVTKKLARSEFPDIIEPSSVRQWTRAETDAIDSLFQDDDAASMTKPRSSKKMARLKELREQRSLPTVIKT